MTENNVTAEEVLNFWFVETAPQQWFQKSEAFDQKIKDRFGKTLQAVGQALEAGSPLPWGQEAKAILAAVILLDQFPRNVYRDQPEAFRFDPLALSLALGAIERAQDMELETVERSFLYLPLTHSEVLDNQIRCVELMESRVGIEANIYHAKEHFKVIEQFGRFPHRNEILGRDSSPEEVAFLQSGGYAP